MVLALIAFVEAMLNVPLPLIVSAELLILPFVLFVSLDTYKAPMMVDVPDPLKVKLAVIVPGVKAWLVLAMVTPKLEMHRLGRF